MTAKVPVSALPATTSHLRLLESRLLVPATTGTRTFVTERTKFISGFDSNFYSYGTNMPSSPTIVGLSSLYEMTVDGTSRDQLASFGPDLDPLFWRSQDQVLSWIETYPQHLHPQGWATFFPFIMEKKKFVASVDRFGCGLRAFVNHLDDGTVWFAKNRRRWVLPQLSP